MITRLFATAALLCTAGSLQAQDAETPGFDAKMDALLEPIAKGFHKFIFTSVPLFGAQVPLVLIALAFTAVFLTVSFKFINLRALKLAYRTVRGKYSQKDDPGQITHFQALTTAVSATVGLGNIAGVAIAIGVGGPGAVFWMIFMGFMGMTSKFTECTLGVKYRIIDAKGRARGGGMYYLRDGLKEKGLGPLGLVLAIMFAIACIGGAIGAGNMFQVNQAYSQISDTFGILQGDNGGFQFGAITAILVGAVIIGGITAIARVTSLLVPFMCIMYVLACLVVLIGHIGEIPAAIGTIVTEAFTGSALGGGVIGAIIQGVKRGVFSNEAGVGSAAMAHAAVKTRKPASEGIVALLEPFIDTVVVCSMTALVIVVTGMWKIDASVDSPLTLSASPALVETVRELPEGSRVKILDWENKAEEAPLTAASWVKLRTEDGETEAFSTPASITARTGTKGGIWLTSQAFAGVISWFPYVLAVAVFLFAFSTMISWSYYGEQAVTYLFRGNEIAPLVYKGVFCLCIIIGAGASLENVVLLSDAMFFAMVIPNLVGLFILLPVVKKELADYRAHAARIDAGEEPES